MSALEPTGAELPPSPFAERYAIEGVVGRGSASTVYRARDLVAGHSIALKVLDPRLSWDKNAVERLRREVIVSRRITHAGVVRVHDLVCAGEHAAIVQDLVVGESLAAVIAATAPMPVTRALTIAEAVLTVLSACHQKGVLHRDIKPSNVLLEANDRVRLIDFGIARVGLMTTVTHTGALLGTPGYQAPEILRGERADLRADLYGVGILLFEMLAGVSPFGKSADTTVLFSQLARSPPDIGGHRSDLPVGLAPLIASLLDPHPEMRPPGAYEVIEVLQELPAFTERAIGDDRGGASPGRRKQTSEDGVVSGPECSACGYRARARVPFCAACGHYRRIILRPGAWFVRLRGVEDAPSYTRQLTELFGDAVDSEQLRRQLNVEGGSFILARGVSRETAEALAEDARRHHAGSEYGSGRGWLQLHEEVRGWILATGILGALLTLAGLPHTIARGGTIGALSPLLFMGFAAIGVMAFLVVRAARPVLDVPLTAPRGSGKRVAHAETLAARVGRMKAGPLQATCAGLIEAYWEARASLARTAVGSTVTQTNAALERLLDKALQVGEKAGALARLLDGRGPHDAAKDLEKVGARRRVAGAGKPSDVEAAGLVVLEAAVRDELEALEAADDLLSTTAGQIVLTTGLLRRVASVAETAGSTPAQREAALLELLASADLDIDTLDRMIEEQALRPHANTLGITARPQAPGETR